MRFWEKLFGKKSNEKELEYDFTTPGLSQFVTFGRNRDGEVAAVVLNRPKDDYHKVIVNYKGIFEDFPGIMKGPWTNYIVGKFNFETGKIGFRASFEGRDGGFRCLWEIQPDGRYWADSDGFDAEEDDEIILYADLDFDGNFITPFKIYSINGHRVKEKQEETELQSGKAGVAKQEKTEAQSDKATPERDEKQEESVINGEEEPVFTHRDRNIHLNVHVREEFVETLKTPLKKGAKEGIAFVYFREDNPSDDLPGNAVVLEVSKDGNDEVSLSIGVFRRGTDRRYSNYLFEAGNTQEEIIAWLKNTDVCQPIILEVAKNLSDKVDEHWGF